MPLGAQTNEDDKTLRVFIFAGQSNMVGSDSKVADIKRFPPFAGLGKIQPDVRFAYCLGRENKTRSDGWGFLQPVNNIVGPELSFARKVTSRIKAPIAIIKVAAGGTHLGGDWNPDEPIGFKMYPLALQAVRDALADLDERKIAWRLEGVMWHQGENDMFNENYMKNYAANLKNFLACWRRDLRAPDLKFYLGELCTKTIWGMDLRPRMYAISVSQRSVAGSDPRAEYIPTAHIGVEIGGGVGLHYHYGTLGQLQHGENYADAYLRTIGLRIDRERKFSNGWPYARSQPVNLFILAGHRNMEGERAFTQELRKHPRGDQLASDQPDIAFKYSLGGGVIRSAGWEPLGLTGHYDNFGPELSFGASLHSEGFQNVAIAKFTHSGSQIIDWTPAGSMARSRHLYPRFINFVKESISELEAKGHRVTLAGICYHLGENDMSFQPYRREAAKRLQEMITQSRKDLQRPGLSWILSQQRPTDDKRVNDIDVVANVAALAAADPHTSHLKAFSLPPQEKKLVIDTAGIIRLGELLAKAVAKP